MTRFFRKKFKVLKRYVYVLQVLEQTGLNVNAVFRSTVLLAISIRG